MWAKRLPSNTFVKEMTPPENFFRRVQYMKSYL